MFKKIVTHYKSLWIGISLFIVMMFAAFSLSFGLLGNQHPLINSLSHWFNQHRLIVIFWHILLFLAIYYGWGYKVDQAVKQQQTMKKIKPWDTTKIKKIKRFRWYLIVAFLLIDLMVYF